MRTLSPKYWRRRAKTDKGWACVNDNSKLYVKVKCKCKGIVPYYNKINGKKLGSFASGRVIYNCDREAYGWASTMLDSKTRVWFNLAYVTHCAIG